MTVTVDWVRAVPRFILDVDEINADPRDRWVRFPRLRLDLMFLGGGHLPLGPAIQAWTDGILVKPCPICGDEAFVVGAAGSPLSGRGSWWGCCDRCGLVSRQESVSSMLLHPRVFGLWGPQGYQPLIQRGDPYLFSFRDGAVQTGLARPEIKLVVPGWMEFMTANYPGLLIEE